MITVQLSSDTIASVVASNISVVANAPVLALCRKLIQCSTYAPETPLEVYRGATLCLTVRSIGEGAKLKVATASHGPPVLKAPSEGVIGPAIKSGVINGR